MKLSALLILAITSSVFSQQQTSSSTLSLEQEVRSSTSEYSKTKLNFSDDFDRLDLATAEINRLPIDPWRSAGL